VSQAPTTSSTRAWVEAGLLGECMPQPGDADPLDLFRRPPASAQRFVEVVGGGRKCRVVVLTVDQEHAGLRDARSDVAGPVDEVQAARQPPCGVAPAVRGLEDPLSDGDDIRRPHRSVDERHGPHGDGALGQGEQDGGGSRRSAHQPDRTDCPRKLLAQGSNGPGQFLGGLLDDRPQQLQQGVVVAKAQERLGVPGRGAGAEHRQPEVGPPGGNSGQRERGGHCGLTAGGIHEVQHDHEGRPLRSLRGTVRHIGHARRYADESGGRDHGGD
jgi:hypothetical protein